MVEACVVFVLSVDADVDSVVVVDVDVVTVVDVDADVVYVETKNDEHLLGQEFWIATNIQLLNVKYAHISSSCIVGNWVVGSVKKYEEHLFGHISLIYWYWQLDNSNALQIVSSSDGLAIFVGGSWISIPEQKHLFGHIFWVVVWEQLWIGKLEQIISSIAFEQSICPIWQ